MTAILLDMSSGSMTLDSMIRSLKKYKKTGTFYWKRLERIRECAQNTPVNSHSDMKAKCEAAHLLGGEL